MTWRKRRNRTRFFHSGLRVIHVSGVAGPPAKNLPSPESHPPNRRTRELGVENQVAEAVLPTVASFPLRLRNQYNLLIININSTKWGKLGPLGYCPLEIFVPRFSEVGVSGFVSS